jgi:AcrR family transcriptional regulator
MKTDNPKERIISAATEIFSEKGYKSATIRDICKKADVSVSLVNYHFKNKIALYEEIAVGAVRRAFTANPMENFVSEDQTPQEKLKNTIRLMMHRLYGQNGLGADKYTVKLIARELTNPTEIMDIIYGNYLMHMIKFFRSIIGDLLGDMEQNEAMRFVSSIAGQCLHPLLASDILSRAGFTQLRSYEEIEKHADHIYRFSIGGINAVKGGKNE